MMKRLRFGIGTVVSLGVLTLAGCGSDGDSGAPPAATPPPAPAPAPAPPPAPPPVGIGPAGGTVTGPNGATIVVPAGALSQTVNLQIAQDSAGAPPLSSGNEPAGAVYALTPHGTSFAQPVTVSIPFDPAQVPGGRTVRLLKTDAAQTAWEPVVGAAAVGSLLTAQVSSLSWFTASLAPQPPAVTVRALPRRIAVGIRTAGAVTADGGVWTWGRNDDGQLGPGSTAGQDRLQAARVTGITNVVAVFPTFDGFAALRSDGRVQGWGNVFLRSLGEDDVVDGVRLLGLTNVVQVAGGNGHVLALRSDGTVWAWGANLFGQLGDGTRDEPFEPVQVGGLANAVAIAAPGNGSMAVLADGSVWAWGSQDTNLCLGPGDGFFTTPQRVTAPTSFASLVSGGVHTLLWNPAGALHACGAGAVATVFSGASVPQAVTVPPVATAAAGRYYDPAAAQTHPFILAANDAGVLNGYSSQQAGAAGVNGTTGVVELAASIGSALFVRADGSVWAWGENDNGQLGDGTRSRRTTPVQVPGLNLN